MLKKSIVTRAHFLFLSHILYFSSVFLYIKQKSGYKRSFQSQSLSKSIPFPSKQNIVNGCLYLRTNDSSHFVCAILLVCFIFHFFSLISVIVAAILHTLAFNRTLLFCCCCCRRHCITLSLIRPRTFCDCVIVTVIVFGSHNPQQCEYFTYFSSDIANNWISITNFLFFCYRRRGLHLSQCIMYV